MTKDQLRASDPVMAAIVDELRPHITGMAYYVDDKLVAGRPPTDPTGTVWLPADRVMAMRAYATSPFPELPRMPKK